eukprot:6471953-Amphidinium_carterae.1
MPERILIEKPFRLVSQWVSKWHGSKNFITKREWAWSVFTNFCGALWLLKSGWAAVPVPSCGPLGSGIEIAPESERR